MTKHDRQDDFATVQRGGTLVISRWLPGPAERVWRYLTDSELRQKWLAAGEMRLAPGAPLEFVWRNDELSSPSDKRPDGFAEEQRMASQVIAVEPMRMLCIAWGKGDVTFTLKEQGDRVLLTITHTELDDPAGRANIAGGWHMHLDILAATLSGAEPASFWSGWARLRDAYAARLAG